MTIRTPKAKQLTTSTEFRLCESALRQNVSGYSAAQLFQETLDRFEARLEVVTRKEAGKLARKTPTPLGKKKARR